MLTEEIVVTYGRRKRRECSGTNEEKSSLHSPLRQPAPAGLSISGSNKRVKLKQYFLDFGQLDFAYSTCKICGLLYARGHGDDEKVHTVFHTRYLEGVQFKGWQRERLVVKHEKDDERIILVLPSDPIQHQIKVKELMNIMAKELGLEPGWLVHKRCKVYLYISLKKIVGCAVAEPINRAFSVLPEKVMITQTDVSSSVTSLKAGKQEACLKNNVSSVEEDCQPCESMSRDDEKVLPQSRQGQKGLGRGIDYDSRTLPFGTAKLGGERVASHPAQVISWTPFGGGCCSTVAPMAAVCGVRGLWVSKAERRKGIASKLIDAVRTSFIYGLILDTSQCAFSQPTLDGKAFAAKYCKTDRFLVYSS